MRKMGIDVFQAAINRLNYIFDEFDNIVVSFSGGKDSGALLNLALYVLDKRQDERKIGLFHLDYEAQYQATIKYATETFERLKDRVEPFWCCVPFKVTTCTSMSQMFWRPWEDSKKDIWVRQMPDFALTRRDFDFYRPSLWDYDFQETFSQWQHNRMNAKKTCVLVGIRAQESLNRWRTIVSDRNINKYKKVAWTTKMFDNVYNAYPIYDWTTEDIWTVNAREAFPYNSLYDLMYMASVPIGKMRVASPFLSSGQDNLKFYRAIDPDTWGKMVSRVNGVNFTAIYGGTKAMGWRHIEKPSHFTWEQYMNFLLDTLPKDISQNYRDKLNKSILFWKERGGCLSSNTIEDLKRARVKFKAMESTNYKTDKIPVRMDYLDDIDSKEFNLIPTYKRMCVCILKNDHLCQYMGFSLTKNDMERRNNALIKYSGL